MRVGIVGCGLIGTRRARAAAAAGDTVVRVADVEAARAGAVAAELSCDACSDWHEVVDAPDVDIVVASIFNKYAMPVTCAALAAGKHVLCEKPLGRNAREAETMVSAAADARRTLKVGFNHRHHPALARARALLDEGRIGEPLSVRAAYGHGGRPGYDEEWRADPELAGGGELLDQGVHVIDLCRWFLGDFSAVTGSLATWFWRVAPLEDNGFALLRTDAGRIASVHTSWTQWKNLFRFEVLGSDGFVVVNGLGGSYGPESLVLGRRRPESGPPLEEEWSFPADDVSWRDEWAEFRSAIDEGRQPLGSGEDGLQAARVIEAIYAAASGRCWAEVDGR